MIMKYERRRYFLQGYYKSYEAALRKAKHYRKKTKARYQITKREGFK